MTGSNDQNKPGDKQQNPGDRNTQPGQPKPQPGQKQPAERRSDGGRPEQDESDRHSRQHERARQA